MDTQMTPYQKFIHLRSYARWREEDGRRETWMETVGRYSEFFWKKVKDLEPEYRWTYMDAINHILHLNVMPSMRCMWSAGPALEFDNVAGYNCAYTTISECKDFAEVLYILMGGAGVGVSVERQYINSLPPVPTMLNRSIYPIVIEDSKQGWAEGFLHYITDLFNGVIRPCDLSNIRPKGSILKTFGGRASGPEPLRELFDFTTKIFLNAQGRKLRSDEVADIVCKIAEIVIVGGVRRSAIMLLTNPSDRRMANFKTGEFWIHNPQRALANVSSCYTEKPEPAEFLEDFLQLMRSGTGERGIVNRQALQNSNSQRSSSIDYGLNPCGEIILRPKQFCNLTEIVMRPADTIDDLLSKARAAAILGVLQSTLTNFRFISQEWKHNTEVDRLLGVSLTGIMDMETIPDQHTLEAIRSEVTNTAIEWSKLLGISLPKAFTCVKPSGTVSQLVNCSSGLHPGYSRYFIRRVRVAMTDPLAKLLIDQGVPWQPEVGELEENCKTAVFEFPLCAYKTTKVRSEVSALDQFAVWSELKQHYTDHNPSCTIYVKPEEWLEMANAIYKHWDMIGGLTLLPYDGGVYKLAPYEEINYYDWYELFRSFPEIEFEKLSEYETEDRTEGRHEFACAGGACEL